MDEVLVFA